VNPKDPAPARVLPFKLPQRIVVAAPTPLKLAA
jgi:hypothetical protein